MFQQKNVVLIISLLAYAFLFILAFIFFRERLNVDTSYYFFKTLNEQRFHIEHDRYVLALAELPVLLGNLFHLPLKAISISYSVWHVFFFFMFGVILTWRYKNNTYLLLFLMLQLAGIIYGFVSPVFEQYYGTAILAGLYIIMRNTKQMDIMTGLLIFVFAFFAISSHPFNLILYSLLFMLDYCYRKNKWFLITFLMLVPLFLVFKMYHVSEYEKGKVSWIFDIVHNKTYKKLFGIAHWKAHFIFLIQYYKEVLAAYFIYTVLAIFQKLYKQLFLVWMFFIASILLINFSYAVTEYSGYIEQVCYLIVPIVLIPLFVDLIPAVKTKMILYSLLLLTCIVIPYRFYLQYNMAKMNAQKTERILKWIEEARKNKSCKNYVLANQFSDISTLVGWDISYSSIIYSAFDQGKMHVSIVPLEDNNTKELDSATHEEYLFRYGEIEPLNTLNQRYFRLCADSSYKNLVH